MKWVNPGFTPLFDRWSNVVQGTDTTSTTGISCKLDGGSSPFLYENIGVDNCTEIWFSYDLRVYSIRGEESIFKVTDSSNNTLVNVTYNASSTTLHILNASGKLLYTSENTLVAPDNTVHNLEFHFKTGENGRVDVWRDTKLFCSFRSPTQFVGNISAVGITVSNGWSVFYLSSFILQDTRRIGLEKFKKLTINPDTEQNMPQGSTTTYTLSGLSDATEFSDITSVCAVLQATSRDANISTGTFSLEGANVGTIDVSDSSGKAYELTHAELNSLTGKPWTRDDIEGKTLSFTVNGAS